MDDNEVEPQYTNANTAEAYRKAKILVNMIRKRYGTEIRFNTEDSIHVRTHVLETVREFAFDIRVDLQCQGATPVSIRETVTVDTSMARIDALYAQYEHRISDTSTQMAYKLGQASFARKLKALTELGA